MIEFFSESVPVDAERAELCAPVLEKLFSDFGYSVDYLNIIFMTDEELLDINREFLQHDYYTDIITFNYSESEDVVEGELYISADRVKDNAQELSLDFWQELYRVMIHGCLHIVGFEDSSDDLKKEMQSFENKYLSLVKEVS